MRLTDKTRWRYELPFATKDILARIRQNEWLRIARSKLPPEPLDILELGCAPGVLSAALLFNRPWRPFGIDFSDDAEIYLETMRGAGFDPILYKADIFEHDLCREFDIVCSFGLIEHFRNNSLEELLSIHDRYCVEGGYVLICVPNFTGVQYLWHYFFDRPDLDNHNIDAMQPATFSWFRDRGYETVFCGYVGQFQVWGNSSWCSSWIRGKAVVALAKSVNVASSIAEKIGLTLRGRSFSPYLLFIGQKPASDGDSIRSSRHRMVGNSQRSYINSGVASPDQISS